MAYIKSEMDLFWENMTPESEQKLQDYFINEVQELGGMGITKDNCEDLFQMWCEGLDLEDITKILKWQSI